MARYKLHLFGTPRLERDGRPVSIRRRKALALLAYVAHTAQAQSRESLATLLWPDVDHTTALANLRRALSHLKSNAGGELLDVDRQKVALPPELEMWNDVAYFNRLLDGVRAHDHFPDLPCPQCVEHLREATALYEHHFLEGFDLSDAPELDEWAFFERQSLRLALAEALQQLIRSSKGQRQWNEALDFGRRWLALDPLHEAAHRELMALYAYAGQQPFALRQYEECVRLLDAELGIAPQAETTRLYEAIRSRRFPDDGDQPMDSAAPVSAGLLPPAVQQLGDRYLVEEQLATGGQGVVYRGRDMETGQMVIIKQLRSDRLSDPESVARFLREGEALHQLNHPNIVRVLDSFEHDDRRAIVMEYVRGGTLRQLLEREGALPLPQALQLGLELADALSRAHHLGILHRDVKPENVLLKENNAPCLTDFGVARLLNEDVRLTRTGAVFGSPAYMSPEALHGEELDERSDIWSFGVLLYEMLAGQRPFEGDTVTDVLLKILQEPLPPLPKLRPNLPPALVSLIEAMLVKERQQRLNSMRVVASALEAIGANREPAGFNLLAPSAQSPLPSPQPDIEVDLVPSASTPPIAAPPSGPAEPLPQLPVHAGPFFGREEELQELASLLHDPQVRLLTIMGPGGIGKTQLALQAARTVLPAFPDGVFFVPLAPLSNPEEIVFAIAESINLHFYQPSEAWEQLLQFLQPKSLLLVLDNFEHLLEGASLLAQIVENAPRVTILVTSRASLNLTFQSLYTLSGLSFPQAETTDLQEIAVYPAVQLILQQAQLILRSFEPDPAEMRAAGQIAALVQGMPLALILAARWVELLSMAEIATEIARNLDFLETTMRDVPPRQRSVRAVFDYSWQQLAPNAQEVFARLTIFRGGFTRHAAQRVANAGLRTLLRLVRKSFVISRHKNRYEIHELLRQYGAQKLAESGQAQQMRDAHSVYYLNALQERESDLRGGRQAEALREIEEDFQNIRAAWTWALERRDKAGINGALEALHLFSDIRSRHQEAADLFARACRTFAPAQGQQAELLWGRLVIRHGFLQILVPSDPRKVGAEIERGLAVAQQHGDRFETGVATLAQGLLTLVTTQNEQRALELHRQAIAHFREVGDDLFLVRALIGLGISTAAHGESLSFSHTVEEAVSIARNAGNKVDIALALSNLAEYAVGTGHYKRAWEYSAEAAELAREIGIPTVRAFAQMWQAFIHLTKGEIDIAGPLLQESYSRASHIHSQTIMAYAAALSALVACFRGDFEEGCRLAQESHDNPANNTLGLVMAPWAMAIANDGSGNKVAAHQALVEGLEKAQFVALPEAYLWLIPVAAVFLAAEGQAETAAELLALAMTQAVDGRGWWQAWSPLATLQQRLQEELGPTRFQAAWERGQKLDPQLASAMLGEL